jgi:TRAP-type mannitol/chloroaromatic compound transport system permease large subunit
MAVGTILMCVIFAATSGVVGATETVVGLLASPPMLRYGYHKGLISGVICAGGALGTIIPPSVLAVVIGPTAQADVGKILLGMFIPGFMLAGAYSSTSLSAAVAPAGRPARTPHGHALYRPAALRYLLANLAAGIRDLAPRHGAGRYPLDTGAGRAAP